jgi:hypothetical protein
MGAVTYFADSIEAEVTPSQLAITNPYCKLFVILAEVALCAEVCQDEQCVLCKDATAHTLPVQCQLAVGKRTGMTVCV